jgi:uncharacterized protein YhjY with autotransporter beta-barrel domain
MADKPASDKLTPRQERAIIALLNEPSVRKAAVTADVSERTLYHWLKNDEQFNHAYYAARREAMSQATARLQQGSTAAVNVILMVMAREATPLPLRLRAAGMVLEYAYRGTELEDLAVRVALLEALNHDLQDATKPA